MLILRRIIYCGNFTAAVSMLEVEYEKTKLFQRFYCYKLRCRFILCLLFPYKSSYYSTGGTPDSGRLYSSQKLMKEATV